MRALARDAEIEPLILSGSRPSSARRFAEMDQTIALKSERKDAEALAMLRTNRGKALMDEANVFLSGIIRAADERLTAGVDEQRANALCCAGCRSSAAIVIVLVVGGVVVTVHATRARSRQARDEVRALNANLEAAGRASAPPIWRGRATGPRCCSRRSTIASPTACRMVASLVQLQAKAVTDEAAKRRAGRDAGAHLCHLAGSQAALQLGRRAVRRARRIPVEPARSSRDVDAQRRPRRLAAATSSSR